MKKTKKRKEFVTTGVSFPKELYAWAFKQAKEDDRSFSYYVQQLIEKEKKRYDRELKKKRLDSTIVPC